MADCRRISMDRWRSHVSAFLLILEVFSTTVNRKHFVQAQTPNPPLNAAANVGDRVVINCTTGDSTIPQWRYSPTGFGQFTPISYIGNCTSLIPTRFVAESTGNGNCNLIIPNATTAEALAYQCDAISGADHYMLLTIIESIEVSPNSTAEEPCSGDPLNITCSVRYSAVSTTGLRMFPSIMWTNLSANANISGTDVTSLNVITSYLSIIVNPPTVSPYSCNVYFNVPALPTGFATNAPNYYNSTNTAQIQVGCAQGAIVQRPKNLAVSVGESSYFNCSTDGSGSITWVFSRDGNIGSSTARQMTNASCDIVADFSGNFRTVKPNSNACNLIVFNANLQLGGYYSCATGFGASANFHGILVVADTRSNIVTNATDFIDGCEDAVFYETVVNYRGPFPIAPSTLPPLYPSFNWTPQSNADTTVTNTISSSKIIVTATIPSVPSYACTLYFKPPINVSANCDPSAPTFTFSWEHPEISTSCNDLVTPRPPPNDGLEWLLLLILLVLVFLLPACVFLPYYGLSKSCRENVNDEFPWIEKALPCMNGKGCECSVGMVLFIFCLVICGLVFVPWILIASHCCQKNSKKSQGTRYADNSHNSDANGHPEPSHYQGLERNTQTTPDYEELSQRPEYDTVIGNDGFGRSFTLETNSQQQAQSPCEELQRNQQRPMVVYQELI